MYDTQIPISVREQESGAKGLSIYQYDGKGKVAEAYEKLTQEVALQGDEARRKSTPEKRRTGPKL